MQIFVKMLTGKTITLQVEGSDLVTDVKVKIEEKEGIPICHQTLVNGNKNLEEVNKSLSSYGVSNESTLQMLLRWNSSNSQRSSPDLSLIRSSKESSPSQDIIIENNQDEIKSQTSEGGILENPHGFIGLERIAASSSTESVQAPDDSRQVHPSIANSSTPARRNPPYTSSSTQTTGPDWQQKYNELFAKHKKLSADLQSSMEQYGGYNNDVVEDIGQISQLTVASQENENSQMSADSHGQMRTRQDSQMSSDRYSQVTHQFGESIQSNGPGNFGERTRSVSLGDSQLGSTFASEQLSNKYHKLENDELHTAIPDEVWLRILIHLRIVDICRMGATSRRYNVLFKDPTLWKDLVFDWQTVTWNLKAINKVQLRAVKVEKLKFTWKHDDMFDLVPNEKIHIQKKASKNMISVVKQVKDTLKVLILEDDFVPSNDAVIKFECLSKLEVLNFPAGELGTSGVEAIAKLKNLRELKIPACEMHSMAGVLKLTRKDLSHLFQELKNLSVVDLSRCEDSVTNETIETLARNNPNLEHLVLDGCYELRKNGLDPLGDCKKLKYLSLADNPDVHDVRLKNLFHKLKNLVVVDLTFSEVSNETIEVLARNNPNLEHLVLEAGWKENVGDSSIRVIAENCPQLKHLTHYLCRVTDSGIKALAQNCPKLQHLDLYGCDLSEEVLKEVEVQCQDLKYIDVRNVDSIKKQKHFIKKQ